MATILFVIKSIFFLKLRKLARSTQQRIHWNSVDVYIFEKVKPVKEQKWKNKSENDYDFSLKSNNWQILILTEIFLRVSFVYN